MALIQVEDVSVDFTIYQGSSRSLKSSLLRAARTGGVISHDSRDRTFVKALQDLSFTLNDGDRLGLIGGNGAGKTTLLRVLAGVYEPTRGVVRVEGHVTPLFDISLGLDPDATGFDNIWIRSAYLGLSKAEIERSLDSIAEFTELGEYLELPVRTYSAGMLMRLAFGVATTIRSDILLLDEWISAGDLGFLEKAQRRATGFVERTRIMVMASHSEEIVRRMCNKVMWLHQGQIVAVGEVDDILSQYKMKILGLDGDLYD